ncbi:hypothetical protein D3C78_1847440 [compost metagenome]
MQARGRDSVGALFVLLHLLEADPQLLGQGGLRQAEGRAAGGHPQAHGGVDILSAAVHERRLPDDDVRRVS